MSEYPTAGRPELPAEERRDVYIMVRLTKDEKAIVAQAAKAAMRSPSDFARVVLLDAVKKLLK